MPSVMLPDDAVYLKYNIQEHQTIKKKGKLTGEKIPARIKKCLAESGMKKIGAILGSGIRI